MASSRDGSVAGTHRVPATRGSPERNYTAERAVAALEILALAPSSAPAVARELGVADRTARRILYGLAAQGYIEPARGRSQNRFAYVATLRLLAMAARLAECVPLIVRGQDVVDSLAAETESSAYLVTPCYDRVVVVASAGPSSPRPWATVLAHADAAGQVLLAYRHRWRFTLAQHAPGVSIPDDAAATIRRRGHVSNDHAGGPGSVAVPVHRHDDVVAALALRGAGLIGDDERARLLRSKATQLLDA